MSLARASVALHYIGDDPVQLTTLEEGINSAGGYLASHLSELGSARSNTNAAWQATEANAADTRTGRLQDSGEKILGSLKHASQAVNLYIEEILQTRRSVDGLREEWQLARSHTTELNSRVLLTPEDQATATADMTRMTEQFDDIQRRYNALVVTMDTAAGYCARALNTAGATDDPTSLYSPATYELDPPPREYFADKTRRHNTAQRAAAAAISLQIIAENRGDPSTLAVETTIPLGSNTPGSDKNGRADITWDDGTNVWIWEVKGPESDNPDRFIIQAKLASSEAATYVKRLQDILPSDPQEEKYRMVRLGFPLTMPPSPTYKNWTGKTEDLPMSNSPYGDGGIVYKTRVQPETTTSPPLPPATPPTPPTTPPPGPGTPQSSTTAPDPPTTTPTAPSPPPQPAEPTDDGNDYFGWHLPIEVGGQGPLEHLADVAGEAWDVGASTWEASSDINQSLNDLTWRLLTDGLVPSDETPIEGLWDGGQDVWNATTDGAGKVASAVVDLAAELNPFDDN